MSDLVITILLCVLVAVVYATAALIQARYGHVPVRELLRVPLWWVAQALNIAGAGLHVWSLNFGALSLIQPLGVLTLVLAVPVNAYTAHRRVTRLEASGMVCTVVGLAGLTMLITTGGKSDTLTGGELVGLLVGVGAVVVACAVKGSRRGVSPLWEAAAGGLAFAVCSALCQTLVRTVDARGLGVLLELAPILTAVAIATFAVAATVLTQRSYRQGLGAPLAVTNLANPASATAIGVIFLGEDLGTSPLQVALAVACAALAAFGVRQLAKARDEIPDVPNAVSTPDRHGVSGPAA
ncbi:DMT family transporter [Actinokineospora bangkokensis]|uniref:Uncharacterized protein n=1 Tax=Actinokineospora bangkokensis TaxID=1193682 RepID=A0A1Q9LKA8_9PSEU|nr:DMT family transporter [Actinokineospora bangkokensis]OLR92433.1 hypothetical protein BJP25_20335 [Actinokineospora bangkokensis]